jgi:cytochrome P450
MLLGDKALICAPPDEHRLLRQLMAPALSVEAVESYLPDITHIVTNTLVSLQPLVAGNVQPLGV